MLNHVPLKPLINGNHVHHIASTCFETKLDLIVLDTQGVKSVDRLLGLVKYVGVSVDGIPC